MEVWLEKALNDIRNTLGWVYGGRFYSAIVMYDLGDSARDRVLIRMDKTLSSEDIEKAVKMTNDILSANNISILASCDWGEYL